MNGHCGRCSKYREGQPLEVPVEPYNGDEVFFCFGCVPRSKGEGKDGLTPFVEKLRKEGYLGDVVSLCDGKYTIVTSRTGVIEHVFRYKECWREVTGDNLIHQLVWELVEARKKKPQSKGCGFTLVELLAVIAILGILLSTAIPHLLGV